MVEEIAAQPQHHPLAETRKPADEDGLQDPAADRDAEVDEHDDRQVVLVRGADPLVDRVAHEQPAAGLRDRIARADEQEEGRPHAPALQIAIEPLHAATTSSPKSAANAPPARISSAGVPDSMI